MKIKDLCSYAPKSRIKAGEAVENAKYLFFTSSADENKRYTDFQFDKEAIIMGTGGNATLHYYNGKFSVSTDCLVLFPNSKIKCKYLYYFFKSHMSVLEAGFKGAGLKHTNKKYIEEINVSKVPDLTTQEKIVSHLDTITENIEKLNRELELFDSLTKARFIEMFGDPLDGSAKYPIHQVGEVADTIDPQPSHRTPPVDESGIPYISIRDCNYKTGRIDFEGARKVSRKILEEQSKRYTLHDGDFVIGKIGTIGNPVFIPPRDDYTLSANVVLVQPNNNLVSPYFLKYSLESGYVDRQFAEAKNSTSQAAFGIQKVRTIKVMNPDLNIQRKFDNFVKQVDKSREEVKKSLEKTQQLYDSLMQEYFG